MGLIFNKERLKRWLWQHLVWSCDHPNWAVIPNILEAGWIRGNVYEVQWCRHCGAYRIVRGGMPLADTVTMRRPDPKWSPDPIRKAMGIPPEKQS